MSTTITNNYEDVSGFQGIREFGTPGGGRIRAEREHGGIWKIYESCDRGFEFVCRVRAGANATCKHLHHAAIEAAEKAAYAEEFGCDDY